MKIVPNDNDRLGNLQGVVIYFRGVLHIFGPYVGLCQVAATATTP
jgi:hypothetical protein